MDQVCLLIPLLDGRIDDAREFMQELDRDRQEEYDASERRIGITKEVWYLAPLPEGSALVAYIESNDFEKTFSQFVQSQDAFDLWFKRRLADSTGVDLNDPPDVQLPELLSAYSA